jgi:ABC-type lipoprotein release transport system permease subunit
VAAGPDGPVTVVGIPGEKNQDKEAFSGLATLPGRREAVVGPGVFSTNGGDDIERSFLTLMGEKRLTVSIAGYFDERHAVVAHDVALLHADDAREIFGLAPGYASDLAIRVFHEQEAEAILPDLAAAFPWPSRMTTRAQALKRYKASTARRGGLFYLVLAPSILSMALIVVAAYGNAVRNAADAGLLKALGWTTPDIVRLFLYKALLVAFPAVASGMAFSYFLVYWPGIVWPGYLFFGWKQAPPGFYLDPTGAIPILMQSAAAVATPYLAANLWPALRCAASDPHDLLRSKGGE